MSTPRYFSGNTVISGEINGECVVKREGFNPLASYSEDRSLAEVAGKILCIPQIIGSTSGGMIIQTVAEENVAPAAFLFSRKIDSLGAAGLLLSDIWSDIPIITVDKLGDEFLSYVDNGDTIEIMMDGTVAVIKNNDA